MNGNPLILGGDKIRLVDEISVTIDRSTSDIAIDISSLSKVPGDWVICMLGLQSDSSLTYNISGYTEIANLDRSDTYDSILRVGRKTMPDPVDTTITITNGTSSDFDRGSVIVQSWRNVGSFGSSATDTAASTALADPPAVTVAAGNPVIFVAAVGHDEGNQTLGSSDATLTNQASNNVGTGDVSLAVGYVLSDGSSFNPDAFTFSESDSTANSWCACTFSLIGS